MRVLFILGLLFVFFSCDEDEDPIGIARVTLPSEDLVEVENATIPIGINIGIDNPAHGGGTIEVSVSGGVYGTDYETSGGAPDFTIDVDPNSISARFSIQPVDDELFDEPDVVLTVALTGTTGSLELGNSTAFQLTIIDDDEEPEPEPVVITFGAVAYTVVEDTGTVNVPVLFSDTLAAPSSVDIVVADGGSATPGQDFTVNGESGETITLTLPVGTLETRLEVMIIDDDEEEEEEAFTLELANPQDGFEIGQDDAVTFVIQDNDGGVEPFFYLETFEGFDGTPEYLTDSLGYENILITQTPNIPNTIILINNPGSFADANDINGVSDHGLNLFYNSQQDPANFGSLDNMAVTPYLDGAGMMEIEIDVSYAFKNNNNADVTFYWSQTYDGSGTFNPSDWTVMGTESVANMDGEGFGNNAYKRKTFSIESAEGFYIGMRVNQTIDNDFYRTRWRFDNIRVSN